MKRYYNGKQEITKEEADRINREQLKILESGDFQKMKDFIFITAIDKPD